MVEVHRRRWLIGIGATTAFVGVAAAGLKLTAPPPAPETVFTLLDGARLCTRDWRGQVALLQFWATSCTTCVAEMPQLITLHQDLAPRGLRTLAVAMRYDRPEHVSHYARTRQLPFELAFDADGSAARGWGDVRLTPTTFLLGRDGRIRRRITGALDFAALRQDIELAMRA
ncbi:MAG: TlpA disulfide reductase family protein [Comamonas sp.]